MIRPVILDCTLRDGGNQNDWGFSADEVQRIILDLDRAGVDVIEVGYRGGSGSGTPQGAGETARCTDAFLARLPRPSQATLAVMIVPTAAPDSAIDGLIEAGVGMLRVAAYPWDSAMVAPYVARAREAGLRTTVNLMAMSYLDPRELGEQVRSISAEAPDVIYVADSFGALTPSMVAERMDVMRRATEAEVGIHVHNNLGLAPANTLAAIEHGATWVDCSLAGMARGAGNMPTELAAAVLATDPSTSTGLDVEVLSRAAAFVIDSILGAPMPIAREHLASGMNDHHFYFQRHVDEIAAELAVDGLELGRLVGAARPRRVSRDLVRELATTLHARKG